MVTRIILGSLAAISFIAAIIIAVFSNRLEPSLIHIWADLFGKKLPGRKPSNQPYIIWGGFFIFLCLGIFSVVMREILNTPTSVNISPPITVIVPTNYGLPLDATQSHPTQSTALSGNCRWVDGKDPTRLEPGQDTECGVSDWNAHYVAVVSNSAPRELIGYIDSRMLSLNECLSKEDFAKAYADVAVVLAMYGREN